MNNVPVDRVCTQQVSLQVGDAQSQIRANKGCLVESCRCAVYFISTLYGNASYSYTGDRKQRSHQKHIILKHTYQWRIRPGEGSGGPVPLFLDQFETAASPLPQLKVWIRHCVHYTYVHQCEHCLKLIKNEQRKKNDLLSYGSYFQQMNSITILKNR